MKTHNTQEQGQRRLVVARLQLAELDTPSASIVKLDQVVDLEHVHAQTFLDLPEGYGVDAQGLASDSLTVRMLELMAIEQWRGQVIPEALQVDQVACLTLMAMLAKHQGYTSLVAGITDNFDKKKLFKGSDAPQAGPMDFPQMDAALDRFFDTLVACDWYRGGNVYLVRSSANHTDTKPYEMNVSSGLVGWKLPEHLVEVYLEGAQHRAGSTPVQRARMAA